MKPGSHFLHFGRRPSTSPARASPVTAPWRRVTATVFAVVLVAPLVFAPLAANVGSVTLAWDPGSNIVAGYVVYYGTSSRRYDSSVDVGNVTRYLVPGLTKGVTYYFAVRAYSSERILSDPSNEASGTPQRPTVTENTLTPGELPKQ